MVWRIELLDSPSILFAHSYTTAHYDIPFYRQTDFLELTCQQEGDVTLCYADGSRKDIPAGTAHLTLYRQPFRASSRMACRHITVGFHVPYRAQALQRADLLPGGQSGGQDAGRLVFYIPQAGVPLREGCPIEGVLLRLIAAFALPEAGKTLRCTALLYELLAVVSEETLRAACGQGGLPPAALLYGRRAAAYIADHLPEKLTVAGVAAALCISPGYLAALFKQYAGLGVIPYIQTLRVARMQELMLTRDLTLAQAGECVGLPDANYASRLFRRYAGQTVQALRRFAHAARTNPQPPAQDV